MYVLHPSCVKVLVAEDGSVWYEIKEDYLSLTAELKPAIVDGRIVIPSSEIIHDMMPALFHPLIGISPLYACAIAATVGAKIGENAAAFFANQSMPGGVVTVPGHITTDIAQTLKDTFEQNFGTATGVNNRGRIAVLSDGMKFDALRMTAEASQMAEQAKMTREDVAMAFHYPMHKLTGQSPPYAGSQEASEMSYYKDCLQEKIEKMESCLDEGLGLDGRKKGVEVEIENLMRMDSKSLFETLDKAKFVLTPNEQRLMVNRKPVTGGNTVYKQEQDHSIEWLSKRDAIPPTAQPVTTSAAAAPPMPAEMDDPEDDDTERAFLEFFDEDSLASAYVDEMRKDMVLA